VASAQVTAARPDAAARITTKRIRWGEVLIKGLLALCALVSVLTTLGIVIALLVPAVEFFQEVPIRDYLIGRSGRRCSSRRTSACSRSSSARCR